MKRIRVYADTSVFGGCFDHEFMEDNRRFFDEVIAGKYQLYLSDLVLIELLRAPEKVQVLLDEVKAYTSETIKITNEIAELRDAYIMAGVVTASSLLDAGHIAAATIAEVDVLIS